MKITSVKNGDSFEITADGRLDAYWASSLEAEIEKTIHAGAHFVSLNMSAIEYISSAGLRILVKANNKLQSIDGRFFIKSPSANVIEILNLTGFSQLLKENPADTAQTQKPNAPNEPVSGMKCRISGTPDFTSRKSSDTFKTHPLRIKENLFSIGIAAFGGEMENSQNRAGEFLAAAGTAVYMPTESSSEPDFMLASGDYLPTAQSIYDISCEGGFPFSFQLDSEKYLSISGIVENCFNLTGSDTAIALVIAELNGLSGAFIKKSPEMIPQGADIFAFPEVRNWFSFTSEKAHSGKLCMALGVFTKSEKSELRPFLRPLDKASSVYAHFHGAVFPYQPLKRENPDIREAVRRLYNDDIVCGVYHLINDLRPGIASGETGFEWGLCWTAPLESIEMNIERASL